MARSNSTRYDDVDWHVGGDFPDDLSEQGNAFAQYYYEKHYLDDYVDLSDDDLPTIYHEPDTPEKYAQVRELLDQRWREWKRQAV
ncbi:hypothetical protein V8Z80_13760 [Orrella sp. JC864]|uniref:DUF7832 domain-containing protein n=1 Tax=Orrella sp. JC864 TaxID=3120298 RepID=UPI00300AC983